MDDDSLIPGVRDFYLLLVMPIAAYWISASIFHLLDSQQWFKSYKIHTYEDKLKRNKATLPQVFRQVLAQQAIQVAFALIVDYIVSAPNTSRLQQSQSQHLLQDDIVLNHNKSTFLSPTDQRSTVFDLNGQRIPSSVALILRISCAVLIADFWQYLWHRIFHSNKFLYKYVHSVHQRLYVPYSYGALYSSLVEAFVVDTIGTTLTFYLSGLSTIQATIFASASIVKSVNDHSGYRFPYNPFDYMSTNTTEFHDVHHQSWGMKYNYSQVYLTIWDDILGTTMPAKEVALRRSRSSGYGSADNKDHKVE